MDKDIKTYIAEHTRLLGDAIIAELKRYGVLAKTVIYEKETQNINLNNLKVIKNEAWEKFELSKQTVKNNILQKSNIGNFRYVNQINIQTNKIYAITQKYINNAQCMALKTKKFWIPSLFIM